MDRAFKIVIVARAVILLFFVMIIVLFNMPSLLIEEPPHYDLYFNFLSFINDSILIILGIGAISIVSGVAWYMKFPSKLVAPFISAIIAIFSVELLYNFYLFLDDVFIKSGFELGLKDFYVYIFILALILGYIKLLIIFIKIRKRRIYLRKLRKRRQAAPPQLFPSKEGLSKKTPSETPVTEQEQEQSQEVEAPEQSFEKEPPEKTPPEKYDETESEKEIQKSGFGYRFQEGIYLLVKKFASGTMSFVDAFKTSGKT